MQCFGKWKWKLETEKVEVWKEILEFRYGSWRDMNTSRTARQISNWWIDLCKVCDVENHSNWFDNNVIWEIKDGENVRFWEDKWVGDISLKERFTRLYNISMCQESVMSDLGIWKNKVCN